MKRRQEIRREVTEIMSYDPNGDPGHKQMKRLEALSIESTLILDETIEKMNATNKALDKSNKDLALSNLKLQRLAIGVSVLAIIISVVLGIIAVTTKQAFDIKLNGKTIQNLSK